MCTPCTVTYYIFTQTLVAWSNWVKHCPLFQNSLNVFRLGSYETNKYMSRMYWNECKYAKCVLHQILISCHGSKTMRSGAVFNLNKYFWWYKVLQVAVTMFALCVTLFVLLFRTSGALFHVRQYNSFLREVLNDIEHKYFTHIRYMDTVYIVVVLW